MLDELFKAAAAIERAGIVVKDWHPKFKPLPKVSKKAPCIRIWLDNDGHVVGLEPLLAEHATKLRKYEPDNGKSFPGFNVRPLFIRDMSEQDVKRFEKDFSESLMSSSVDWTSILEPFDDLWKKDTIKTVERVLGNISADLKARCGDLNEKETVARLFNVVEKMNAVRFQEEYREALKSEIQKGDLPLSTLVFVGKEGKEPKFSVFLDIKEYEGYPVAHEKTIARINTLLLGENQNRESCTLGVRREDAYGKSAVGSENPKMAQVNIPSLGGVYLRSQSKAIPAQSRYHCCEGETFVIGDDSRTGIKKALEWLSKEENKGKTFGVAGDKELLFAYSSQLPPDSCPDLALLLGASNDEESKFEELSESVISQLRGTGQDAKDAAIEIFSLRKMDKARTKVVYYRNTTVASLEAASRAWNTGFKNFPPLDVRTWSAEKNERGKSYAVRVEPQTLFPVKLHRILNTVWTTSQGAVKQSKVKLFEPSTGLQLLLNVPDSVRVNYVAERFLSHAHPYFIALCRARGRGEIIKLPDIKYYPGILGLLLYKLDKTKESYMNESAFQLGRFLRVADEIHRLYCEVVRKGDIPPELCGSSMLTATLENPTQALAQLGMRFAPYLKWAKAYHGTEKGGIVHYWLNQWSPIADSLHETDWPTRTTSMDRAQIFLGYLSSFPETGK